MRQSPHRICRIVLLMEEVLAEALAKRRCRAAGYPLDIEARRLTSFAPDDCRPLWATFYLDQASADVAAFRARALDWLWFGFALALAFSPAALVGYAMICAGGWR